MTKRRKEGSGSNAPWRKAKSSNERCNIMNVPMKNSNQYDWAMASLNCLTFVASSSIVQIVVFSTFSAQGNGYIGVGSKQYLANEWSMNGEVHTFELHIHLAINELISTENFTKATPLVTCIARRVTKWKAEVVVGFLWIIVRTNFVYPQSHLLICLILQEKQKGFLIQMISV